MKKIVILGLLFFNFISLISMGEKFKLYESDTYG